GAPRARFRPPPRPLGLTQVGSAIAFQETPNMFPPKSGPFVGGAPQHAQARRMAALVIWRKLRGIVLLLVEETQRDQPPIDFIACLGRHFGNPARRDPGKGADRVPEELDVIVRHTWPFVSACRPRLCDALAVVSH